MNVDRESIQNRSTDAVFERGENYRAEGRIQRLDRFDDLVTAAVSGSKLYDVSADDLRGFVRDALAEHADLRERFLARFGDDHKSVEEYREEIAQLFEQHADPGVYDAIDFSRFFEIAEQYRDRDRYLAAATVYRAIFEAVDEKSNWINGAYDHYARTIQTALEGYADCVLATDPSPEEFDTYAGVLEARAASEPPINSEQFWRELDDLEERYEQ